MSSSGPPFEVSGPARTGDREPVILASAPIVGDYVAADESRIAAWRVEANIQSWPNYSQDRASLSWPAAYEDDSVTAYSEIRYLVEDGQCGNPACDGKKHPDKGTDKCLASKGKAANVFSHLFWNADQRESVPPPDSMVVWPEGPKDAVTLARIGLGAIASPSGRNGYRTAHLEPIQRLGVKVLIAPDNDNGEWPVSAQHAINTARLQGLTIAGILQPPKTVNHAADLDAVDAINYIRNEDNWLDPEEVFAKAGEVELRSISPSKFTPHTLGVNLLLGLGQGEKVVLCEGRLLRQQPNGLYSADHAGWVEALTRTHDRLRDKGEAFKDKSVSSKFNTWISSLHRSSVLTHIVEDIHSVAYAFRRAGRPAPYRELPPEQINRDPFLIGLANGVYSFQMGRLLDKEEIGDAVVTQTIGMEYDPDYTYLDWPHRMRVAWGDTEFDSDHPFAQLLYDLMWYVVHRPNNRFLVCVQDSGSGKSTLISLFQSMDALTPTGNVSTFQRGHNDNMVGLAQLEAPARLTFYDETKTIRNVELLKQSTGEGPVVAQEKFLDTTHRLLTAIPVFFGNRDNVTFMLKQIGESGDGGAALRRRARFLVIPEPLERLGDDFLHQLSTDPQYKKAALHCLLAWGSHAARDPGNEPEDNQDVRREHLSLAYGQQTEFFRECWEKNPEAGTLPECEIQVFARELRGRMMGQGVLRNLTVAQITSGLIAESPKDARGKRYRGRQPHENDECRRRYETETRPSERQWQGYQLVVPGGDLYMDE